MVDEPRWTDDARCKVIAEIGVNHDGDPSLAHDLIDVAAAAGSDVVKFQTFDPERLVAPTAPTAPYQRSTGTTGQRELLAGLILPVEVWPELATHANERGLTFLSTPFDVGSAEMLAELGVHALKVPSGELTNLPFLRDLADLGLPLLVSTGMGDLEEIDVAVKATASAPSLSLMHCVSCYPAPTDQANLRAILTMRARFGLPVGWSDHTEGSLTALGAVALGATLLEKHLTLDRTRPGPDHAASADPDGFRAYVADVRALEQALGDGIKRPMPCESDVRVVARRSWHARRRLVPGTVLRPEDLVALRPASGISPSIDLVGRKLIREVPAGTAVVYEDLAGQR